MPNKLQYFAQTPEGNLLVSTGFDPVQRWNGLTSGLQLAGVPAPPTKLAMATTGEGDISGTLIAYQRWLDSEGHVSSLSPISDRLTISSSTKTITDATNETPIEITSSSHGYSTGDQVKISEVTDNTAANGVWTITVLDGNTFTLDGSAGNGEYISGGVIRQGAGQIDYTSVDAPSDSRVVRRQILRTKDGDAGTVYVDVDTTDLVATSFSSTNTDDDLGDVGTPLFDTDGNDNAVTKYEEPPDYKPYLANLNGRMLATGDPIYSHGAVALTNGSASVTGIDTDWTDSLIGRELWVVGSTARYTISAVNESTQVITLTANYAGTTAPYARYAIRMPVGYRRSFEWSAALEPEAWDPDNSQELAGDRDAGEVTGIVAFNRWIYAFAEHRIFRISFQADPGDDGYVAPAPLRGLANQRTWAIVEDYIRILDRQGAYEYSGNDLRDTTDSIQDLFRIDGAPGYKINWRWRQYFHTVHDPEMKTLRHFVSLTGRYPRHALCYNYRGKVWWIEEYPFGVTSSVLGTMNGRRQVFLGAEARKIVALSVGDTDGPPADSGTLRGTCTSAGMTWIADTSATFPASAKLVNTALRIVSGKGKGQWRKVVSISGTTLYVDHAFLDVPDTTSVYQLGGIEWAWKSGWYRWASTDKQTERAIELVFEPKSNDARMAIRTYRDRSETPEDWGFTKSQDDNNGIGITDGDPSLEVDPTKTNGFVRQQMDASRETDADGFRFLAVELVGVTNAQRQKIYELGVEGASMGAGE